MRWFILLHEFLQPLAKNDLTSIAHLAVALDNSEQAQNDIKRWTAVMLLRQGNAKTLLRNLTGFIGMKS